MVEVDKMNGNFAILIKQQQILSHFESFP